MANPDVPISRLPLLTPDERHQLIEGWNDTATDYPADLPLCRLFEAQAERTPDAIAVAWGEETLTYHELNRHANRLANCLRDLGVGPDMLVAVCVERSPPLVVALLGILKAGGPTCRSTR